MVLKKQRQLYRNCLCFFVQKCTFQFEKVDFLIWGLYNGNAPKNKYFLVLQCTEQNVILASLPTSQDHVPTMLEKTHGCINQSDINFNCYLFEKGRVVCTNGFSFPKETYVYGFRLQLFDLYVFAVQENNNETKTEVKGCLSEEEYNAVILCLKNSSSVKRKFKAML